MARETLTEHETGFLNLLAVYGRGFDASGPRISTVVKAAARELVRKGLVEGKPKSYSLTTAGRLKLADQ